MANSPRILILWLIVNCALVTAQQIIWKGAWNNGTGYRYSTFFGVYVDIEVDQRKPVSYDKVVINAASYYGQVGAANFSATGSYMVWIGPVLPQASPPGVISLAVKQFTSEVTTITVQVQNSLTQTGLIIYDISFPPAESSSTTVATHSTVTSTNLIPPTSSMTSSSMSTSPISSSFSTSTMSRSSRTTAPSSESNTTHDGAHNTTTESTSLTGNANSSIPSDSKRVQPNIGAIIGGTFAAILLLGACIFLMARRRRKGRTIAAFPRPYIHREAPTEEALFSLSVAEMNKLAAELAQTNTQGRGNGTGMASAPGQAHLAVETVQTGRNEAPPAYTTSRTSASDLSLASSVHAPMGYVPMAVVNHSDSVHTPLKPSSKVPPRKE